MSTRPGDAPSSEHHLEARWVRSLQALEPDEPGGEDTAEDEDGALALLSAHEAPLHIQVDPARPDLSGGAP